MDRRIKQRMFENLRTLKKGETTTYKALALKFSSHPRAIAQILKANKDPKVPCYKVIKSNGELGGYNGLLGKTKEELLKEEGRVITN